MRSISKAQPAVQFSATETQSTNILGPVFFTLSNLDVEGMADIPELPTQIAPGQSPYIVGTDEPFQLSVDIEFNSTPLTDLLICLGTRLEVHFALEGLGGRAAEVDLEAREITRKGVFAYTVTYEGTPEAAGLTPGLYKVAAVVNIGPVENPCSQVVLGYGYIAKRYLQVYAS
jgi:hypothetical protein